MSNPDTTLTRSSLENWEKMTPQRKKTWLAISRWHLATAASPDCYNAAMDVDDAINAELAAKENK